MKHRIWRIIKKYYLMLIRAKGTPHSIALGIALGLFAGTAIPLGQVILALILAFIFKANKIFAVAATFITNPYTTPFLYTFLCWLGVKVIGFHLTFFEIKEALKGLVVSFDLNAISKLGNKLIVSYLVGGTIFGVVIGIIGYFVSKKMVVIHRKRKEIKRLERRAKYIK